MKYRHHKYTWTKPFGNARHSWELVGPRGAVHFHVSESKEYGDSCGLEFHHTEACGWRTNEAPHHLNCPLTGGRCWHDSTSLYALEALWPRIKDWLEVGDHDAIFLFLEREADERFNQFTKGGGAQQDHEAAAVQELEEIASGAYGDDPHKRGWARDELARQDAVPKDEKGGA